MRKHRDNLFKAMQQLNIDVGDSAQFDERMNNRLNRDRFFTAMEQLNIDVGTRDDFEALIAPMEQIQPRTGMNRPLINLVDKLGLTHPTDVSDEKIAEFISKAMYGTSNNEGETADDKLILKRDTGLPVYTADDINNVWRMLYGGVYAVADDISNQITGQNIALAIPLGLLKLFARKGFTAARIGLGAAELGIAALAGKELPRQWQELSAEYDRMKADPTYATEFGRKLGALIMTGSVTALAGAGGAYNIRGGIAQVRHARVLKAITARNSEIATARADAGVLDPGVSMKRPKPAPPINEVSAFNERMAEIQAQDYTATIPKTPQPAGLKKPVSGLTQKELLRRSNSASKFKSTYKAELDRRALIAGHKTQQINRLYSEYHDLLNPFDTEFGGNGRIPYDHAHDLIFDTKLGRVRTQKIHMVPEAAARLKGLQAQAFKRLGMKQSEFAKVLREVTGDNTRRMSGDDMRLLAKRMSMATDGTTRNELVQLLKSGVKPLPVYTGGVSKYRLLGEIQKQLAAAPKSIIERLGQPGKLIRDRIEFKTQVEDVVAGNWMLETKNLLTATFGKDKARLNRFMRNQGIAETTGEWPTDSKGKLLPDHDVYSALERIGFNPIADLSDRVNIQVYDPITKKSVPQRDVRHKYYWPRRYDHEFKKRISQSKPELYEQLKAENPNLTDRQIVNIIDSMYDRMKGGFRAGNLEYRRIANLKGWLGDPDDPRFSMDRVLEGLRDYYKDSARRLTDLYYLEGYAPDKFKLSEHIGKLQSRDVRNYVKHITDQARGIQKPNPVEFEPDLSNDFRSAQVLRKLPLMAIQNVMQSVLGTLPRHARIGFRETLRTGLTEARATLRTMRHGDSDRIMVEIGDTLDAMLQIGNRRPLAKAANWMLHKNFGKQTETFNRLFAQRMGENYVRHVVAALSGDPTAPRSLSRSMRNPKTREAFIKELKTLGISDETIKTGQFRIKAPFGRYGIEELRVAGHRFSRSTQFGSGTLDLPVFASTLWGKVVAQFSNFTFAQSRLANKHIIKPFLKNPTVANAKPIIAWLIGAEFSGMINHYARRSIQQYVLGIDVPEEGSMQSRMLDYALAVSPYGLAYSFFRDAQYGRIPAAGPTLGDVQDVIRAVQTKQVPVHMIAPTPFDKLIKQEMK